jgi:hypothetical protein
MLMRRRAALVVYTRWMPASARHLAIPRFNPQRVLAKNSAKIDPLISAQNRAVLTTDQDGPESLDFDPLTFASEALRAAPSELQARTT